MTEPTDTEVIARQAKRIAYLENRVSLFVQASSNIHMEIFGIGGPLNDNKLLFSKEQMMPFWRIKNQLGTCESKEDVDCPGMGVWWCPHCGEGNPDNESSEENK